MKSSISHIQQRHIQPVKPFPKLILAGHSLFYKGRVPYLYPIQYTG
jgi:hypothetical protein